LQHILQAGSILRHPSNSIKTQAIVTNMLSQKQASPCFMAHTVY